MGDRIPSRSEPRCGQAAAVLQWSIQGTAGLIAICLTAIFLGGCGSLDQSTEEETEHEDATERSESTGRYPLVAPLSAPAPDVHTVQLYRTGDETSLPVIALQAGQSLTLEFDLLQSEGRPLSVYVYHANRQWRKILQPSEYMGSFNRDRIYDYVSSQGTEIPYIHYRYQFPNNDLSFTRSGNYIIRVTEQGKEEEILLEQAFFVSEQAVQVSVSFESQTVQRRGGWFVQPVARIAPAGFLRNNLFDVTVCFLRSRHYGQIRCTGSASLINASYYQFHLSGDNRFAGQAPIRVLDLSNLQGGGQIKTVRFNESPYGIALRPDYGDLGGPPLEVNTAGQSLVSSVVDNVSNPDTEGEYVRARFQYVPPNEEQVDGPVLVVGSFNSWHFEERNQLTWDASEQAYIGDVLIKQGVHEYQYRGFSRDSRRNAQISEHTIYSAMVYYSDPMTGSDRLVAMGSRAVR